MIHEYTVDKYLKNIEDILLIGCHTAFGTYGDWTDLVLDDESALKFKSWIRDTSADAYDVDLPTGSDLPYSSVKVQSGVKRQGQE